MFLWLGKPMGFARPHEAIILGPNDLFPERFFAFFQVLATINRGLAPINGPYQWWPGPNQVASLRVGSWSPLVALPESFLPKKKP